MHPDTEILDYGMAYTDKFHILEGIFLLAGVLLVYTVTLYCCATKRCGETNCVFCMLVEKVCETSMVAQFNPAFINFTHSPE